MTIEERLQKLERESVRVQRRNRRLLAAVGLAIAACAAGIVALRPAFPKAQPAGAVVKEIRAKRFVLEDDNGRILASFDNDRLLGFGHNCPELEIYDESAVVRARLSVGRLGPFLALFDAQDKLRAALQVFQEGPLLILDDGKGERCAELGVLKDGAVLRLYDGKGGVRSFAP